MNDVSGRDLNWFWRTGTQQRLHRPGGGGRRSKNATGYSVTVSNMGGWRRRSTWWPNIKTARRLGSTTRPRLGAISSEARVTLASAKALVSVALEEESGSTRSGEQSVGAAQGTTCLARGRPGRYDATTLPTLGRERGDLSPRRGRDVLRHRPRLGVMPARRTARTTSVVYKAAAGFWSSRWPTAPPRIAMNAIRRLRPDSR